MHFNLNMAAVKELFALCILSDYVGDKGALPYEHTGQV